MEKIKDHFFWGGAMIAIHYKLFHVEGGLGNNEDIIDLLKKHPGGFKIGHDKKNDYYGPFQFDSFSYHDFYSEEGKNLVDILKGFEKRIPDLYFGDFVPEVNTITDQLKTIIPAEINDRGNNLVFRWNYGNDNQKAGLSTDVMGYDYFFSVIGFNSSTICLITIWFD